MAKTLQPPYEIPAQAVRIHAVKVIAACFLVVLVPAQHVVGGYKNAMPYRDDGALFSLFRS
jgi:hypothetical protein